MVVVLSLVLDFVMRMATLVGGASGDGGGRWSGELWWCWCPRL